METLKELLFRDPQYPFGMLIGLYFMGYPLYAKRERKKTLLRRTATARGKIVGHEIKHGCTRPGFDSRSVGTRHPVMEFEVNGSAVRSVSEVGASWKMLREGQTVNIRYNPENPEDAEIDHVAIASTEQHLAFLFPLIGAAVFLWGCANLIRAF
jgi:hypothetical protein